MSHSLIGTYIGVLVKFVTPLEEGQGVTEAAPPEVVVEDTDHDLLPDEGDLLTELLHLLVLALEGAHLHRLGLAGPDLDQGLLLAFLHHYRFLPPCLNDRNAVAECQNAVSELVPPRGLL
jgi:hypothetical protein